MSETFQSRHLGPRPTDIDTMIEDLGAGSLAALVDDIVPSDIRLAQPLTTDAAESEAATIAG